MKEIDEKDELLSLRRELEDYKTLFENSSDGVLIIKNNIFVECNEKIVLMLGYKNKDELLNLHPSKLSPEFQPDGQTSFDKAEEMMGIALHNKYHQFEWIHTKASGENFWVEVTLRTVELHDCTSILVIWKDISTIKETQRRLIEIEKMSALGSLVAGVAHEINTPLGVSITGITHILNETKKISKDMSANALSKSALTNFLETVEKMSTSMYISLRTAAKLVRSFKQVAIDQHTEDKRNFNLKEYCDEVLLSLHSRLKNEPIIVKNEVDENLELYSFAGIFSQTITNFVINSIIHGFEDKTEGCEILIKGWQEDENVFFTFEDNGRGISEKNMQKVFNPFFTTKLGQGGSGLGLHIIYNLVSHKLQGDIKCESTLGKGTKMIIKIPRVELEMSNTIS